MLFNSFEFLFLFLPAVLLAYRVSLRFRSGRASVAVLIVASLFFYAYWDWRFLGLLGGSVLANFALGRALGAKHSLAVRRTVLACGVVLNLGLLGWFKYAAFASVTWNELFGADLPIPSTVLPLAISFFTFQQIAWLIDVYRTGFPGYSLGSYTAFVVFFPQLIAGPIVHHSELVPQLAVASRSKPSASDTALGLTFLSVGLFKKVVLADSFAPIANQVFDAAAASESIATLNAWIGSLAYTLQLYFDFSGYSDMAIGLGCLFGIHLPLNFDSPYRSRNIIEFWRRWHMTLSRFLRDYVYFGLGGNRKGPSRRYVNLMLTMLLGGLWHGAGWSFVFWGGLHGLFLLINHVWRESTVGQGASKLRGYRFAAQALTFLSVSFAWVYFRAETAEAANTIIASMATVGAELGSVSLSAQDALMFAVGLVTVFLIPNTQQWTFRFHPAYEAIEIEEVERRLPRWPRSLYWSPTFGWALLSAFLMGMAVVHLSRVSDFIYYQF